MRRSLSVKATYDGVVRLPMSLAMISTLRERKEAHQNSSLVSPRHPRRRPSRASCHHPHHRVSRARSRCDEISRGRRRNAARVATRPRTVPPRTTDRTKHTQKNTRIARSLARVPRRITADHRASIVALAAIRIIACIIDRHRGEEKRPPIHPSRFTLERTDRVARHRRTNTSCRDRSRSRDLQPYS